MKRKIRWLTFSGIFSLLIASLYVEVVAEERLKVDRLKIATWNVEWLTEQANTKKSSIKESYRTAQDIQALHIKFIQIAPDILAFQEVDSKQAIKQVIGNSYNIYLSDRALNTNKSKQFDDVNQYTGFAVSNKWQVHDPQDIELSPNSKLRFASYIVLKQVSKPDIHLLSVHLKHGCPTAKKRSRSCKELTLQAKVLNQWIKQRVDKKEEFIIMGDFNHDLSFKGDWLWLALTQGIGIGSEAQLTTENTTAKCEVKSNRNPNRLYRYPQVIDHILVSENLAKATNQAHQVIYTRDEALNYHLSDHCPVVAEVSR